MNYFTSLIKILKHPSNQDRLVKTISRILWWKLNQLFFKLPVIYNITKSTKIICEPNSSYGSYVVYARYPEYEEMEFIHRYVQNNDVMIDVGANIGAVSLLAADKITNGHIYAFEPTPKIVDKLLQNIRLNNLENRITVFDKAVSNSNKDLEFVLESESEVNHISNRSQSNPNLKKLKVAATTIDTFLSKNKIKHLDIMKVDVEGAEYLVFEGAKNALKLQSIDVIVFEVNKKASLYGYSQLQVFSLLKEANYTIYEFLNDSNLRLFLDTDQNNSTVNLIAISKKALAEKRMKKFLSKVH